MIDNFKNMKLQTPKEFRVAVFIDAANFEISLKIASLKADEFIDLRECEFAIKKAP